MREFAKWLYKEIGVHPPKQETFIFRCDKCVKNKPIEEMNAEMYKGLIKKLCNSCFLK